MPQSTTENHLSLALSPAGHLYLYSDTASQEPLPATLADKITALFSSPPTADAKGILHLGFTHFNVPLPPTFTFWQQFSRLFVTEICKLAGLPDTSNDPLSHLDPPLADFDRLITEAPFMRGVEYLNQETLTALWQALIQTLQTELIHFNGTIAAYLEAHHTAWHKIGRVCFHLAENKNNSDYPFAFLATYTSRLSSTAIVQHLPLGRALQEYAGEQKRTHLLALLLPVQKAAEHCLFLKKMVDDSSLFQPLAWTPKEAYQFLQAIPLMEAAGIIVRIPNWWNPQKPPHPQINIAIGKKESSTVGLNALLDFDMHIALPDGEKITLTDLKNLLNADNQLIQIKGQWVAIDNDKLKQVLAHWQTVESEVKHEGLSFAQGMRLLAGARTGEIAPVSEDIVQWSHVSEGGWLREVLKKLRQPGQSADKNITAILKKYLQATLRPYQTSGVTWLWLLYQLGLGGCLADDMGLGKTIQIISLLLLIKHHPSTVNDKKTHLLILPASLLGNWQAELQRFSPNIRTRIVHASVNTSDDSHKNLPDLSQIDLVITTYAYVHRLMWLKEVAWDAVLVDEAQSIKNPSAKQTQAIKALSSRIRFILTGTPIENRILDLWSLFDFVAPGLLGSSQTFANYAKKSKKREEGAAGRFYAAIRHLVNPYILRRLKSDKRIISDLPDKTEVDAWCTLSKQQVALYQHAVNELQRKLQDSSIEPMARRGLVLSYLLRFKQICNHPHQWLGHGEYDRMLSGKFMRLQELSEVIAEKQEKVLVFTQFREIIPALHLLLEDIFKRSGLILHGQTSIKKRAELVAAFQEEQGPPFFILSLKAGGTGLNLTAAAHVIHFDRWWNPAVENQATDRAYRIGQKKNVLVHKFICRGTIEEKIDALINAKKSLANDILASGHEIALTEMNDAELLSLVTLDIHRALG